MKNVTSFLKQKIIAGLLMLLPVTILIILLGKLWNVLELVMGPVSAAFGLDKTVEIALLVLLTCITMLLACFFAGLVAHYASVNIFHSWIDKTLHKFVPGYNYVKMLLEDKTQPKENRACILVWFRNVWQPGMLIEENEYCGVVYLPNCPNPDTGITCIVGKEKIRHLNMTMSKLNDSMENFGKGLADVYQQYILRNEIHEYD